MSEISRRLPDNSELLTDKPAIFDRPSLDWLAYAETRRLYGGSSGNLSDRPTSMNNEGYQISGSSLSYDEWLSREIADVKFRHSLLLEALSLTDIAYPNPVHKTDLLTVSDSVDSTSITVDAHIRASADAALVTVPGIASAITPADCPVINLVDEKEKMTLQIHAGYQGLGAEVVKKVFKQAGITNGKNLLAYISPFAIEGFEVYGDVLDSLSTNPSTEDFVFQHSSKYFFDLGGAAKQQLITAGVEETNIQVSTEDTLSQDTLFSYRNRVQKGTAGRNGVVLGIRNLKP